MNLPIILLGQIALASGQPAPSTGIFLTPEQTAQIIAEIDATRAEQSAAVEHATQTERARCDATVATQKAGYDASTKVLTTELQDAQKSSSSAVWRVGLPAVAIGLVGGIITALVVVR